MKHIICILILLIPFFLIVKPIEKKEEIIPVSSEIEKEVRLLDEKEIITISLEDYIVGVVACEMPASFNIEALKAQAVASRTYALEKMKNNVEYDLENSTNNQCYIDKDKMKEKWKASYDLYYTKIANAVNSTEGEYVSYEGKVIKALYFSTSNGYTEDVTPVFGGNLEYLESVSSPWDLESSTYKKEIEINVEDFLKKLKLDDKKITNIVVNEKSESGRVNYITINGKKIKGTTFRNLLGLRSTDFDIEVNNNKVLITTRGYGHGVGLSQYGSNGMANEGYTYKEILKYYYKNTEISSIN